jgi:hypothetical protein
MEMDASKWPDQICMVLKPMPSKSGDGQMMMVYLPIYTSYQAAIQDYPHCQIFVMSLVELKRELEIPT